MSKIKSKAVLVALLLMAAVITGYAGLAAADGGDPGSAGDPLVTRSFVERYVQEYIAGLGLSGGSASLEWVVAELETGQEFIGKAGTEIIVRSGSAVVVDPSGGGIPDLTAGKNVMAGQVVENNHLFSLPKSDGRGIKAQKPTIIMYRGF
ncbi:hypothetical protein [Desulfallas thermosapovorans]|uniref:Uncharacterized protein n=1 Tax=Desulfallas thermosapovorans DSM 6562 TaxID=1121431 RepID=A0A5S4ZNQ3_9FIRM|nr:hypothetical protein [Desulfallas thermosapovorans]TYO93259.1 hypothetical protein LX24_02788 [Desulfallas thermosapovorans DSM 6562]